ncbi:S-layer homology domain-containing protein [Cohnella silvisoli]|uniref:S-layer homology domain-containing protein n=1 Tax=Cohnella silvisoli TaxID=2873699 RepID=A0ABV1KWD6_9BACL|nr:S-layer homology domain-containing protein [Cohnella silvisoli]MCD9024008.1 S-layer homology domain-containing protein [Cohnella silvisoli]
MKQTQPIWKKTAAATLALSMLVGGATGVMASAKSSKHGSEHNNGKGKAKKVEINLNFGDLNQNEWKWAYDHIIRLAAQGVFNGYEDGDFKPRNNITRIEALVAAVRLLGLKEEAEKPENMNAKLNFKDFDQLKKKYGWAVGYVTVALENDLFSETETSIQADKPATRLWASVLLVKALKLEAEAKTKMDTVLPFRDAKQIPAGSVGYVAVALEKNLITGYTVTGSDDHDSDDDDNDSNSFDRIFLPNKPVTRAELAALLDRVDQQLPDDKNAQAITGTIQVIANGSITVKKADNTTVSVPVDANVFIFRKDVKAPLSALQVGDEALVRTFQGKAVFIEVTKPAASAVQLTDSGKVSSFTLNAQGKIATISITKDVNGTQQVIIYNVDANVAITGNNGVLSPNLNVIVKGENNVVKSIEIQA